MNLINIHNFLVQLLVGIKNYNFSWIEFFGTISGLLCIWFASKEKIISYFFGLINVSLFMVIFFRIQLYASLLLQIFFIIANIYGWYSWSTKNSVDLQVRWLSIKKRILWIIISIISIIYFTLYINEIFFIFTEIFIFITKYFGFKVIMPILKLDPFPFIDTCILILSIVAMIFMTQKYIETWFLWININIMNIGIFIYQGVYIMALEYILLTIVAFYGCLSWIKSFKKIKLSS